MQKVDILCPDCGKLIVRISKDSVATVFGYCRRCKAEKLIEYRAKEPNVPK